MPSSATAGVLPLAGRAMAPSRTRKPRSAMWRPNSSGAASQGSRVAVSISPAVPSLGFSRSRGASSSSREGAISPRSKAASETCSSTASASAASPAPSSCTPSSLIAGRALAPWRQPSQARAMDSARSLVPASRAMPCRIWPANQVSSSGPWPSRHASAPAAKPSAIVSPSTARVSRRSPRPWLEKTRRSRRSACAPDRLTRWVIFSPVILA